MTASGLKIYSYSLFLFLVNFSFGFPYVPSAGYPSIFGRTLTVLQRVILSYIIRVNLN